MRELLLMGWAMLFLSACTFSAPQFESALSLAKSIGQAGVEDSEQAAVWLASVNGQGAVLTPYDSEGFVVFANTDGDAIAFDGWIIRSVVGFGLNAPVSITGKDGDRVFTVGGSAFRGSCSPWVWQALVWRQDCDHGASEIVLDESGNIQKISMALGPRLGVVALQVAD